jgi:ornithine cyclodeaminase
MRVVTAAEVASLLPYRALADALAEAFRGNVVVPNRHHHEVGTGEDHATHLLMPAWTGNAPGPDAFLGCKVVNVFPTNNARGLPAIYGTYLLMSGETGAPLAAMDGTELTARRTAAASALAARYLARPDSRRMVMVGAGALAPHFIRAHAAHLPLDRIAIWNHRPERAASLARTLAAEGLPVEPVSDLESAVRQADLVSCATISRVPLVSGTWLKPGTHVDCAGAYNMLTREIDDDLIRLARVIIDTPAGFTEGGDVAQAIASGAITRAHVAGDLFKLARGEVQGRTNADQITLFKSIGSAIEDLAAAMLVWSRLA